MKALPTLSYLLLDPERPFIHRDLSWIQFNDRVLAEARLRSNPYLKRLKFLSISASNLDEFFMIRFASLLRLQGKTEETRAHLLRVHGTVLESVRKFGNRQARTLELLKREGKNLHLHLKLPPEHPTFALGKEIFTHQIQPKLEVRTKLSALQELHNLQSLVRTGQELWEVPRTLAPVHWVQVKNEVHLFFLDDLLLTHLDSGKSGILRITRDADFTVDLTEGDREAIPDIIRKNIGSRERGRLVRLQYQGNFPKDFLEETAHQLKLDLRQCFRAPGTLCLPGLIRVVEDLPPAILAQPGFSNPPLKAMIPTAFTNKKIPQLFSALEHVDFMLHHPYDSFDAFLAWLRQACEDPEVFLIEQTIYRTDSLSQIVDILKTAAKKKKVRVALELRARFDESHNIKVAEELQQSGVEVNYGFGALKLHAKVTLVSRKVGEEVRYYTHLSTGNYNAKTARAYTDMSIFTGNQEIGADARHFFDSIYDNKIPSSFRHLVVAPTKLHQKIRALIKSETEAARQGKKARIFAKVNALIDEKIIEDLYTASQAGVTIDLVVRGACSLIPGVKDLSENIRVISIVDRFLEHSRIYYFEHSQVIYLSSADWMPRNFFSRLEIAFPVLDKRLYDFLVDVVLPGYLKDNTRARRLKPRGTWTKPAKTDKPHRAQQFFSDLAANKYAGTPLAPHDLFKTTESSR